MIKVQSARTATSVAVTAPENSAINVPVDLSATISPTPTGGTVQFKDGSNNLGAPQQVTSAQVKLTTSFTTPGQHSITAIYSGTTEFAGSTSTPQIVGVAAADSVTTTFVNLSGSAATGDQVALSASVFPTPTGERFSSRTVESISVPLSNSSEDSKPYPQFRFGRQSFGHRDLLGSGGLHSLDVATEDDHDR